jgi:hypothetical protein
VERSFAWAARFGRLARDYERLAETRAGLHYLAFVTLMVKRFVEILAPASQAMDRKRVEVVCFAPERRFTVDEMRASFPAIEARQSAERREVNALHRSRYGGGDMLLSEFIDKVYLPWARTNKRHPRNDEMPAQVIKDYFKKQTFNHSFQAPTRACICESGTRSARSHIHNGAR